MWCTYCSYWWVFVHEQAFPDLMRVAISSIPSLSCHQWGWILGSVWGFQLSRTELAWLASGLKPKKSSFLTCLLDHLILLVSAHLNLFANFWLGSCGTRNTADDLFPSFLFYFFFEFSKVLSYYSYNVALKNLHFLIWQSNVGVRATAVLTNSGFCEVSNVCEDHSPYCDVCV